MFRHIVMWKFADDSDPGLNRENAIKIKTALEEFEFLVHGAVKIEVHIDPLRLPSSDADILLDSVFESHEAYEAYRDHPNFRLVLELVESCTEERLGMDFKMEDEGA